MTLFAISDLHLGFTVDKPMDRFGDHWKNHPEKIATSWRRLVQADDTVLICGDTSWATRLHEARADLDYLEALPGRKVLLRGNHDYWWSSRAKVAAVLSNRFLLLQNNHFVLEGWAVCGARGWNQPGEETSASDHKIFERELGRLRLSLESAPAHLPKLAMLHYPPFEGAEGQSEVLDLMLDHGVKYCIYGHLHAVAEGTYATGKFRGIEFRCVSADMIDFHLVAIPPPP